MNDLEILKRYLVGRTDVYALQQQDGSYRPVYEELSDGMLKVHLSGEETVGTYTLDAEGNARCCTWDFDDKDNPKLAIWKALSFVPVLQGPWMMFESGGKGAHVVQAFDPPLAGPVAYEYARDRARAAGLWDEHGPTIECNPKQARQTEKLPLGNLTKLPLGRHQVTGRLARMLEGSKVGYVPTLVAVGALSALGPTAPAPAVRGPVAGQYTDTKRPDGWIGRMLYDGDSGPKRGRSNTLTAFKAILRGLDFPDELVRINLEFANECFPEALDEDEMNRTILRDL